MARVRQPGLRSRFRSQTWTAQSGEAHADSAFFSALLSWLQLRSRQACEPHNKWCAVAWGAGGALPSFPGPLYLRLAGGFRTCCPTEPMKYIVQVR